MEILLAFRWYLALQLFGLAALPLTLRLFRHLPGRGYAFARILGLLLGGWVFWILLVFGWLPNSAGSILVALLLLAAAGTALWLKRSGDHSSLSLDLPIDWRHIVAVELLFAITFAAWCMVRAYMPRIETSGGEKWMEIAFLNAILRSPRFPPHDPWLSGFAISYYYFGYVINAMLIRLSGVSSTIGFNLGIASLFALTCIGAYGLVYALLARKQKKRAAWGGLFGPILVAITGNLEGLLEVLHARGLFPAFFWQWLDIRSINIAPPPISEGSWIPTRFIWWWQASRVLHDYAPWSSAENPVPIEVIDEFPAFSFLLGDMHPHLLALPFVLLALALALSILLRKSESWEMKRWGLRLPLYPWELFIYAVCLGGLAFLNVSSDFVVYLFVVVVAYIVTLVVSEKAAVLSLSRPALGSLVTFTLILGVGGFGLYLPFWVGYRSQVSGIMPNLFNSTRLPQFLVMFGPLLFPTAILTVAAAWRRRVKAVEIATWGIAILLSLLIFLLLAAVVTPQGREYLTAWRSGGPIPGLEHIPNAPLLIAARLRERILSPWTPLVLIILLSTAVLTLLAPNSQSEKSTIPKPETAFVLLLVITGVLLTLSVEFVYVRDLFNTRMNTVFKFYFQAWAMWGVAGAYGMVWLLSRSRLWAVGAATVAILLVLAGLVYPALAIPSRAREYGGEPTLDGAAHLYRFQAPDFAAIDWLNENIEGTPVILETPADHSGAYRYEGRVSAFTGLPTVLGWSGHEHQWRGSYDEQGRREPIIETIFTTTSPAEAMALLEEYNISYVFVGPTELIRYPAEGLAKFAEFLDVIYSTPSVTIYRRGSSPSDPPSYAPGLSAPQDRELVPQP